MIGSRPGRFKISIGFFDIIEIMYYRFTAKLEICNNISLNIFQASACVGYMYRYRHAVSGISLVLRVSQAEDTNLKIF